jgi:hypothetical protein
LRQRRGDAIGRAELESPWQINEQAQAELMRPVQTRRAKELGWRVIES